MFHRWHHASEGVPATSCNFASLFPFIDLVFGTYHLPAEEPTAFGVWGEPLPDGFWGQLFYPLTARS